MRAVRSRDTGPERRLRAVLAAKGFRGWEWQPDSIEGKPDVIFRDLRIAVFVDGCFWHGCRECHRVPRSNITYWRPKIRGNRTRDRRMTSLLRKQGWTVFRFWEHEILGALEICSEKIAKYVVVRARRRK